MRSLSLCLMIHLKPLFHMITHLIRWEWNLFPNKTRYTHILSLSLSHSLLTQATSLSFRMAIIPTRTRALITKRDRRKDDKKNSIKEINYHYRHISYEFFFLHCLSSILLSFSFFSLSFIKYLLLGFVFDILSHTLSVLILVWFFFRIFSHFLSHFYVFNACTPRLSLFLFCFYLYHIV